MTAYYVCCLVLQESRKAGKQESTVKDPVITTHMYGHMDGRCSTFVQYKLVKIFQPHSFVLSQWTSTVHVQLYGCTSWSILDECTGSTAVGRGSVEYVCPGGHSSRSAEGQSGGAKGRIPRWARKPQVRGLRINYNLISFDSSLVRIIFEKEF